MKTWNVWEFLAGLGIFLLGMSLLQDAIKALSGKSLKRLIRMYTKTRIRSILSGFVSTSILQSSSASSLMLVAFVGAGLMDLSNAIGVILGSNIGSTMTSWIVATMGFKVKLESFAMPLVGLGGISYVLLGKKEFWKYLSLLFVGFGFLFMGIGYMKSSVDVLASKFDVNSFKSYGLFSFLLFGTVLTALIQASSAAIAIVLTALNSGIITFEMAIAIVIGTNIGTTATVLLGTIGGTSNQKKVAFSHFFFNIITAFISVLLLPVYSYLIQDFLHLGQDPVIALATFHSLFNVFGVLLFFPFVKQFALFIEKISPKDNNQYANFHSLIDTDIPEAAIHEFKKEVKAFLDLCIYHNLKIMSLEPELIISDKSLQEINFATGKKIEDIYEELLLYQAELYSLSSQIQKKSLEEWDAGNMEHLLHSIRVAIFSAKNLRDVTRDLENLEASEIKYFNERYIEFRKKMLRYYTSLSSQLNKKLSEEFVEADFTKLLDEVNEDDKKFLQTTLNFIAEFNPGRNDMSRLIVVNRSFVTSTREIISATREFSLLKNKDSV